MKACEKGTFLIKVIRKGYLICQNGIQKGERLDLGAEPPHIKLCRVHYLGGAGIGH